jgi:hypothetical protein
LIIEGTSLFGRLYGSCSAREKWIRHPQSTVDDLPILQVQGEPISLVDGQAAIVSRDGNCFYAANRALGIEYF